MKTSIAAILLAATLIISSVSCNWFRSGKPAAFNIEGEWIIDSMENQSRDSGFRSIGLLVLALDRDSLPLGVHFYNDSSYRLINSSDSLSGRYSFSADRQTLFVTEAGDTTRHPFQMLQTSDSAFSVRGKDSLVYYLRRR